jgi:nucleotide-binding universal stress UspA family protein
MSADLVVIGTNQRAGLARVWQGSVSRHLLHTADGDVATVPASAGATRISRYERILVATDFSDAANRAIGPAYGLVSRHGVVHLVHVAETPDAPSEQSVLERLAALVPPAAAARGILTIPEVIPAEDVAQTLLQLSARHGVDAVCLATHGRTGLTQVVLGSVAQEVVRHARCPVVLLPPHAAG